MIYNFLSCKFSLLFQVRRVIFNWDSNSTLIEWRQKNADEETSCQIKCQIFTPIPLSGNQRQWFEIKEFCLEWGFPALSWCPPPSGRVQRGAACGNFPRNYFGEGYLQDLSRWVMLVVCGDPLPNVENSSKNPAAVTAGTDTELGTEVSWRSRLNEEVCDLNGCFYKYIQIYIKPTFWKVLNSHGLNFSGADSLCYSNSQWELPWACPGQVWWQRTKPLLVTLETGEKLCSCKNSAEGTWAGRFFGQTQGNSFSVQFPGFPAQRNLPSSEMLSFPSNPR